MLVSVSKLENGKVDGSACENCVLSGKIKVAKSVELFFYFSEIKMNLASKFSETS